MLPFILIVILCSNFLSIKSEDNGNLTIEVPTDNCTTNLQSYTFTEGQNLTLVVQPHTFIDYGWWNHITANGSIESYGTFKTAKEPNQNENKKFEPIVNTTLLNNTMAGTWEFKFYILQNNAGIKLPRIIHKDKQNYSISVCRITVKIVPETNATPPLSPSTLSEYQMLVIIASVVGAVLVAVIIAQAAYIFCLKKKAQKLITLNTHNNLSKRSESIPNDTARYCSNPGQKMMKAPIPEEDNDRDSVIYEAPNIEIPSRMPMQPPQPPAINTMPRTPRQDHNMRIDRQEMLASALNSPSRSPMPGTLPPNFHRSNYERDNSVANRLPLPLPPQAHPHNAMFQEVYEEMETEENTYEPPPVINTMPPKLPMPPKKVPTGNLLDVKENTLKLRQVNKPPVTPKPLPHRPNIMPNQPMTANEFEQALRRRNNNNNDTIPRSNTGHMMQPHQQDQSLRRRPNGDVQSNELEEALRRRNNNDAQPNELEEALRRRNEHSLSAETKSLERKKKWTGRGSDPYITPVKQVPIQSIPDPSSRSSPKPKPPPALKSKPPPVRHSVQEEIYYNEASSDEEWTYEPLKPLNSYDANIYNV